MTPAESRPRPESPVQTVAKAAEALDHIAAHGELTAAELAELAGWARSSVYRLLGSLASAQLVEPGNRRGTFQLGLKLFQLGSHVAQRFDERQLALPVMERVHEATEETVFLCVRRGDVAVCIERLNGKHVQALALRLGGFLPLHFGAAPRVLLAYEPEEVRADYLRRVELVTFTPKTPCTPAAVRRELAKIRSNGYAVSDQDVTVGIAALGAPIFDHTGRIRAALSISGVRPAVLGKDFHRLCTITTEAALEISSLLGYGLELPGRANTSG
jgi:DNA-binding IclR family transcriptional regulator